MNLYVALPTCGHNITDSRHWDDSLSVSGALHSHYTNSTDTACCVPSKGAESAAGIMLSSAIKICFIHWVWLRLSSLSTEVFIMVLQDFMTKITQLFAVSEQRSQVCFCKLSCTFYIWIAHDLGNLHGIGQRMCFWFALILDRWTSPWGVAVHCFYSQSKEDYFDPYWCTVHHSEIEGIILLLLPVQFLVLGLLKLSRLQKTFHVHHLFNYFSVATESIKINFNKVLTFLVEDVPVIKVVIKTKGFFTWKYSLMCSAPINTYLSLISIQHCAWDQQSCSLLTGDSATPGEAVVMKQPYSRMDWVHCFPQNSTNSTP